MAIATHERRKHMVEPIFNKLRGSFDQLDGLASQIASPLEDVFCLSQILAWRAK